MTKPIIYNGAEFVGPTDGKWPKVAHNLGIKYLSSGTWCAQTPSKSSSTFYCTRKPGHLGPHIAMGGYTQMLARWYTSAADILS